MRAESLAFRTSFFSFSVSPRIPLFGRLLRTSETGRRGSGSLMCRSEASCVRTGGLRGDLSPLALRSAVPGAGYRDPRRDSAVPGEIRIISQIVSCGPRPVLRSRNKNEENRCRATLESWHCTHRPNRSTLLPNTEYQNHLLRQV
jgi:hypothetical protein